MIQIPCAPRAATARVPVLLRATPRTPAPEAATIVVGTLPSTVGLVASVRSRTHSWARPCDVTPPTTARLPLTAILCPKNGTFDEPATTGALRLETFTVVRPNVSDAVKARVPTTLTSSASPIPGMKPTSFGPELVAACGVALAVAPVDMLLALSEAQRRQ